MQRLEQIDNIHSKQVEMADGGTVAISVRDIEDVLKQQGLEPPDLAVLQATQQSYRALLLQPAGPIYADCQRIGPLDLRSAQIQADQFLSMAAERGDQLVITPEYFLPVASLRAAAKGNCFPAQGALWVLGCESMTPKQLAEFKDECVGSCDVIFEDDPHPQIQGNYFDPVAYCFSTKDNENRERRVILIQFKTVPSRDEHGFENKQLRCGQVIYRFRGVDGVISLSTIICSDAFSVGEDQALNRALADRTVLIHIQLNPKPKHTDYRRYRNEIFRRTATLTDCDIICLNWAQNIVQHEADGVAPTSWKNENGSAWYLPQRRCSVNDSEVEKNEARGLYYTWHEKKRHVLHFHYDPAVFALTVPKVVQAGLAVQDVLIGPLLDARFIWDKDGGQWCQSTTPPETGWNATINSSPEVLAAFQTLQDVKDRLRIERAISLSCGPHNVTDHWQQVDKLDVCRIGESEVVGRATLQLDRDSDAKITRQQRISRVAVLGYVLANEPLPPAIKDLAGGSIGWSPESPNTNVSKVGALPGLVAYLGEDPPAETVERIGKAAFELLRRENKEYKNRVAVCYRTIAGVIRFGDIKPQTDITYDGGSMVSITEGL